MYLNLLTFMTNLFFSSFRKKKMRILQCPFEDLHMVNENRFDEHVKKCRENHPELDYKFCSKVDYHLVHVDDYDAHVKECVTASSKNSIQDISMTNEAQNARNDSSKDSDSYKGQDPSLKVSNSCVPDPNDVIAMAFTGIECIDLKDYSLGFESHPKENSVIYSKGRVRPSSFEGYKIKNRYSQLRRPMEALPPGFGT